VPAGIVNITGYNKTITQRLNLQKRTFEEGLILLLAPGFRAATTEKLVLFSDGRPPRNDID
jgi:hypothetical protein